MTADRGGRTSGKGGSQSGTGGNSTSGKGGSESGEGGNLPQGGVNATAGDAGASSIPIAAGAGGGGQGEVVGDTYVLTDKNRLLYVARASGAIDKAVTLSGLDDAEVAVGMDFRPSDGALYVLSDAGRLYTVNLESGVATLKTTLKADPADTSEVFNKLVGTRFGIDFNPVANRLRVVSDTGQNLRINVDVVDNTTTDGALNPGTPAVSAAAYTNSFAAACRTRLYVVDAAARKLLLQDPPNDGKLVEVGSLGASFSATLQAFEIATSEDSSERLVNTGVIAASEQGNAALYAIDLATGLASNARKLDLDPEESIVGLGIEPPTHALAQTMGELAGVTVSNKLVSFNRSAPGKLCSSQAISGLASGEELLGIDVRPADGKLYALSNAGKLYTLATQLSSPASASNVAVGALAADSADASNPFSNLSGTHFGMDFNPVPDRLRVISDTGQNLRINTDTPQGVTTDASLVDTARAGAAAYTNSFAGARSTTLFVLDAATDTLARVGSDPATTGACPGDIGNPNCGALTTVGPLGIGDITTVNGFDIDGKTGVAGSALAAVSLGTATTSTLISVDLDTGAASNPPGVANATIGGGEALRGLAFLANPSVTVRALTADNHLVSFDPRTPNIVTDLAITGLYSNECLNGIDVRPLDGKLYALGNRGRLYTIDPVGGAAKLVGMLNAAVTDDDPFSALTASNHGVDFNPAADLLRVVDSASANLRVVPSARVVGTTTQAVGAVFTDALLSGAAVAAAYTNSFAGASATTLFDIDSAGDKLLRQGNPSPNDGVLTPVGPLGIDASGDVGFDIAGGRNGLVLAAILPATQPATTSSSLYVVSLSTGAAAAYPVASGSAVIGSGTTSQVRGLAIDLR